jgi:hypothetical protein
MKTKRIRNIAAAKTIALQGYPINAIRVLWSNNSGLSLADAKIRVEKWIGRELLQYDPTRIEDPLQLHTIIEDLVGHLKIFLPEPTTAYYVDRSQQDFNTKIYAARESISRATRTR